MNRDTILTVNIYDNDSGTTICNKHTVEVLNGNILSDEPILKEYSKWITDDNIIANYFRDKGFFMTSFQNLFENTTNIHFVNKNFESFNLKS